MSCPKCGKEIEKDSKFCGHCGYEFDQKKGAAADTGIDMDFFEKVKGFLIEPSKTFDAVKGDTLNEAMKYYVCIAAIYSALIALLFAFAPTLLALTMGFGFRNLGMMPGVDARFLAIGIFVVFLIFMIIGVFIIGAIYHIGVYIVGGKKGIEQTIKALMYGQTPGLLLGWIPIIGIIAGIWSFVLYILGIRQLQEITTGKAILAVLIPIIIIVVLIVVLAAIIAAFVFGIGG